MTKDIFSFFFVLFSRGLGDRGQEEVEESRQTFVLGLRTSRVEQVDVFLPVVVGDDPAQV